MASRADGAVSDVHYFGGDEVSATFVRYADDDPLRCPSRPSVFASYRHVSTPDGPCLEPAGAQEDEAERRDPGRAC